MSSLLHAEHITQRFGGLTALNDININIEPGTISGIIGPNGSGKTTFFNVITGIYTPTEGNVILDGENITRLSTYQIADKGMARTFQNIRLFKKMTALDNIIVGMHTRTSANLVDAVIHSPKKRREDKECAEKAHELLKIVDLEDFRYELSASLPYGHQRRLEIARALATDPKILLLDEPAAGMNEQETDELLTIVRSIRKMGKTIILIEHDMKFVMNLCDKLYVLNYGNLIAQGGPKEVSSNQDVIDAYLGKEDSDDESAEG